MENPSEETNPNFTPADGVCSALATRGLLLGNKCGRPSENVMLMEDCSMLERPGSPVDVDLQPTSKKGRNFEESSEVLMQTDSMTANGRGQGSEANTHIGGQEHGRSFRDTLMGGIGRKESDVLVKELDVEVVNRRRRNMISTSTPCGLNGARAGGVAGESRFMVLVEEDVEDGGEGERENVRPRRRLSTESRDPVEVGIRIWKDLRKTGSNGSEVQGGQPKVVAQGVLRHGKTSLNPGNHMVVAVDESERNPNARSVKGRVLPFSLRGGIPLGSVKKVAGLPLGQKGSLKPRKKDD
ncbi:hypothetical protein V6N12_063024 [Hibiscus sabdariffa]|uniref:Uncharacterized protein n=1 Tax=Hibiscus sabdariffa TaxID=183260 RepID=A0ABR2FAS9_9ROSI